VFVAGSRVDFNSASKRKFSPVATGRVAVPHRTHVRKCPPKTARGLLARYSRISAAFSSFVTRYFIAEQQLRINTVFFDCNRPKQFETDCSLAIWLCQSDFCFLVEFVPGLRVRRHKINCSGRSTPALLLRTHLIS